MYTQCTLVKKNRFTQCWLDSSKVKVGRFVRLTTLDNDFWKIIAVGHTTKENPELKHRTWNNNI